MAEFSAVVTNTATSSTFAGTILPRVDGIIEAYNNVAMMLNPASYSTILYCSQSVAWNHACGFADTVQDGWDSTGWVGFYCRVALL